MLHFCHFFPTGIFRSVKTSFFVSLYLVFLLILSFFSNEYFWFCQNLVFLLPFCHFFPTSIFCSDCLCANSVMSPKTINEWAKLLKMQHTKKRIWKQREVFSRKEKKQQTFLTSFTMDVKQEKEVTLFLLFAFFFFFKKRVEKKKGNSFQRLGWKRKLFLVCSFFCFLSDVCLATFWFLATPVKFVCFLSGKQSFLV